MANFDIKKSKKSTRNNSARAAPEDDHRGLYAGLIRLHVLHHAVKETVYGFAMMEELRRHGYVLSAGTLYPILHGLERQGLITSSKRRTGGAARRVYRATAAGRKALTAAKAKVRELFGELFEEG
ncbi:MAG TPA: PadR family transcriptional regulator [Stellaceae bacterium]|nr:PadR family transcriptional regulator [Stellaceae bacterium]